MKKESDKKPKRLPNWIYDPRTSRELVEEWYRKINSVKIKMKKEKEWQQGGWAK